MSVNLNICCNTKRKSGGILIELNFLFIIIILICGLFSNSVHAVLVNYKKTMADMEMARCAHFTKSILCRDLSYNTTQVRLSKDLNGKDQIICRKTFENVRCYWYVSNSILYRKTIKGAVSGVNPFSNPEIQIIDFRTERLANNRLGILMTMKHLETGLVRKMPFVIFLNNGLITD